MQPLIGPFGDDAVAALISAVITAAVAVWLHLRSRQRPKHLVCTELLRTSLLHIGQEAEAKTKVQYDKTEVEHLSLVKLRLRNTGSTEILQPEIAISIDGPKKLLDVRTQLPDERYEIERNANEATLQLSFINSYSEHHDEVLLDLISDGGVKDLSVVGSGPGWSVKFMSLEAQQEQRDRLLHGVNLASRYVGFPTLVIASIVLVLAFSGTTINPRLAAAAFFAGVLLYGVVPIAIDVVLDSEEPGEPIDALVLFGRILTRWVIRLLLALFLATLVYAALVSLRQSDLVPKGVFIEGLCGRMPSFCRAIGLR